VFVDHLFVDDLFVVVDVFVTTCSPPTGATTRCGPGTSTNVDSSTGSHHHRRAARPDERPNRDRRYAPRE